MDNIFGLHLTSQGSVTHHGLTFEGKREPPPASYFMNVPERQGSEIQLADFVAVSGDGPVGNYGGQKWYLRVPGRMPVMVSAVHRGRGGKFIVVMDGGQELNVDGRAVMFKKAIGSRTLFDIISAVRSGDSLNTYQHDDLLEAAQAIQSNPAQYKVQPRDVDRLVEKLMRQAQRMSNPRDAQYGGYKALTRQRQDKLIGYLEAGEMPDKLARDFTKDELLSANNQLSQWIGEGDDFDQWSNTLEIAIRRARKAVGDFDYMNAAHLEQMKQEILEDLRVNGDQGLSFAELESNQTKYGRWKDGEPFQTSEAIPVFRAALQQLTREGKLNKQGRTYSAKGWNSGVDDDQQQLLELLARWLPTLNAISPDKLQQLAKYPNDMASRNRFSLNLQGLIRQGLIANRGGRLTLTPQGQAQVEGEMNFITDSVRLIARELLREIHSHIE